MSEFIRICQNFSEHIRKYHKILEHILTNIIIHQKIFRMYQNIPVHVKLYKNISETVRLYQNISEYDKTCQIISEYIRIY